MNYKFKSLKGIFDRNLQLDIITHYLCEKQALIVYFFSNKFLFFKISVLFSFFKFIEKYLKVSLRLLLANESVQRKNLILLKGF